MTIHPLLLRQMKKSGISEPSANPQLRRFIELVNQAYHDCDSDRDLLTHAMELSSKEMGEINARLENHVQEAQRATQSKGQFLANMSHELRTPLNGVIGLVEMLTDTLLDEEQLRLVELAKRSARALVAIVNDILDLSRIEAGKYSVHPTTVEVRLLLDDVAQLFSAAVRERSQSFILHCTPQVPTFLKLDEVRFRQIVSNLLGNSVKFTVNEGGVVLYADVLYRPSSPRELHCVVADTGVGIPPEKLTHIFEAFAQADESVTRRFGGTGLGLTITKALVEVMGGRMWVQSKVGVGSAFHFTLPLVEVESADAGPVTSNGGSHSRSSRVLRDGVRVLLAEDNRLNQKVAQHVLQRMGCVVTIAENGREAVKKAQAESFDVILMDCHMPELSGFEATREIRAQQSLERLPIIALTALAMEGDRERCLQAGMNDYLPKPLDRDRLRAMLAKYFPATMDS